MRIQKQEKPERQKLQNPRQVYLGLLVFTLLFGLASMNGCGGLDEEVTNMSYNDIGEIQQ